MRHIDPDVLALLALGERAGDDADLRHLEECAACASELSNLSRAARVGRSTLDAELLSPSPRVWDRIAEDVAAADLPRIDAESNRRVQRRSRWVPFAIAASVIGMLAVGGFGTWQLLRPAPLTVVASANLEAFPDWPDSTGVAVVEEAQDGSRFVRLDLDVPEIREGYTEVWLITSDATRLVSLGFVDGTTGTFAIPDGIDIADYDLVDVSSEPLDGDPTHSGDSIVRGQLTA